MRFRFRSFPKPATIAATAFALAAGYFWGARQGAPGAAAAVKPYHLNFELFGRRLNLNLTVGALGVLVVFLVTALALAAVALALAARHQKRRTELANRKLRAEVGERKRAEAALRRASEELRQFAYIAAHDLQEPLRNVTTALGIFGREYRSSLDVVGRELIGDSMEGARRLHRMVKDLLELTTVVENLPSRARPVDANIVVENVLSSLRMEIAEKEASVTRSALPMIPVQEGHLHELFENLLDNALKYARRGVRPSIMIAAEDRDSEWLFSVADNGIGFDPAFSRDIFAIFKRLHQRHEYPGNGIGLAICSRIVSAYGGSIWAEGRPNEGAIFRFTLPRNGSPL